MSIEDMKLGNNYIVKAYKGDTLIFDRNAELYITTTGADLEENYIPIVDGSPISYGDTVILDFVPPTNMSLKGFYGCIIGGCNYIDTHSVVDTFCGGVHVAYRYKTSSGQRYITYGINTYTEENSGSRLANYTFTPGERQTLEISITDPQSSDSWRQWQNRTASPPNITVPSGFFLFGYRKMLKFTTDTEVVPEKRYFRYLYGEYEEISNPSGNPSAQYQWSEIDGSVYICDVDMACAPGDFNDKFYRITIKDSNNNLKYDFKPKIQNDHIGVIDLVSGNFYPCNDDTKFRIGR